MRELKFVKKSSANAVTLALFQSMKSSMSMRKLNVRNVENYNLTN